MNRADRRMNRQRLSVHGILFYAVGGLFILTMLSFWLVCGLYAKYKVSDSDSDLARVAMGIQIDLKEHGAKLVNGVYELEISNEVGNNTYKKVIPGVDIPKDPFIRLKGTSEVDFELYVKITESNFPVDDNGDPTVTYEVDETLWELVVDQSGSGVYVYKYKSVLDSSPHDGDDVIRILKPNKDGYELTVSQYYKGNGDFTLTFEAWVEQVD